MKALAVVGLLLAVAVLSHAQTQSKPEDGFVSPESYTNAFFGFSVPFPSGAQLTLLKESPRAIPPYRHVLFGASTESNGHPFFVVLADDIALSRTTDPENALRALGAHKLRDANLGGRDFASGQSKSGGIFRNYYVTAFKGYMLYFSVWGYNKKALESFQHSIEAIEFFDPATAKQHAGPDSRPYDGPPLPTVASPHSSRRSAAGDLANLPAGTNYSLPLCIKCPRPPLSGVQGVVTLEVVVRKDGTVGDIRVLKGVRPDVDKTVIDTVMQWKLRPAKGPDRKPVAVNQIIEIQLQPSTPSPN